MARELGLHGAAVVLAARSDDAVAAAVERLRAEGIAASGRHCDTGDLADVEAVRDEALARGTLDIWINNAGTSGVFGGCSGIPVPDQTEAGDARTAQRAARPPPPEQQDATGRHRGGRTPGRRTYGIPGLAVAAASFARAPLALGRKIRASIAMTQQRMR